MKTLTTVFLLLILYLVFIPGVTSAQEQMQSGATALLEAEPFDTTNTNIPADLGESFTATNGTHENYVSLKWTIYQQCVFGTNNIGITLYRDNVQIFSFTYTPTTLGRGYSHGYTDVIGPGKSHTYKLVRRTWGFLCNDYWSPTAAGSTKAFKKPANLSVSNPTDSDKFIKMSWKNESAIPVVYRIYDGSTHIATTSSTSYTVSTTPGKSAKWGVATYSSKYNKISARVSKTAATHQFHEPKEFFASEDTTLGYVRLGWTSATDYGTQFKIYREGEEFATIPVTQKSFLDYDAIPGQDHRYVVKTFHDSPALFSVPSTEKVGTAVFFSASDGNRDGQVKLSWTDFPPGYKDELRIYRDGEQLQGVGSNDVKLDDDEIAPGKLHEYKLEVLNDHNIKMTVYEHGFAPADGSVKGFVSTPSGSGGVKNVELRAFAAEANLSSALKLDGIDDYVSIPALRLNSNTVTMSAWIKRDGTQSDSSGLLFSRDRNTIAGLYLQSSGELRYNWGDQAGTYDWASGLIVPNDTWTFVALVIEPEQATLYVNDSSAVNTVTHNIEEFDGKFAIGRADTSATSYFKGWVDEVSVWKTARLPQEVSAEKQRILSGTETDLVAYWRFNLGSGDVAGDYAEKGDNHGTIFGAPVWEDDSPQVWHYGLTKTNGSYTIPRINWEEDVNFTIKPFKTGHGFKGANFQGNSIDLPFSGNDHEYRDINFIDTTSIEISGWVYHKSNPPCPVANVKILIDDLPTGEVTDSTGHYSTTVVSPGQYTISTEYLNHSILPVDTLLDLQEPVTDLVFWDTTRTTLKGKIAGGCDNFLGVADIHIKGLVSDCIDTVLTTDASGLYEITLPAQQYSAQVVEIDNPDSLAIINYFSVDTLDISAHDSTHNFIYHSPPEITIAGFREFGCAPFDVPIMEMQVTDTLTISIFENYADISCLVDSGFVIISDNVGVDTSAPDTLTLKDGKAIYAMTPGYPNLIPEPQQHPYQRSFQVIAHIEGQVDTTTQWVLVEGNKPNTSTFVSTSPELPFEILRDPPGDGSYSYLSENTTTNLDVGFSAERTASSKVSASVKTGIEAFTGQFVLVKHEAWGKISGSLEVGATVKTQTQFGLEIANTTKFQTSGNPDIIGESGDVFVGAAMNLIYATTNVLEYDADSCKIDKSKSVIVGNQGFATTFMYTETHIRNTLMPQLAGIRDIYEAAGSDSARIYQNQIDVWNQVLVLNQEQKDKAIKVDNYTFSADAERDESLEVTASARASIDFSFFIENTVAVEAEIDVAGVEIGGGVETKWKYEFGASASTGLAYKRTTGYVLNDDDEGDFFTVDIKADLLYMSPVFDLKSGRSSCPWEPKTEKRDTVGLTMDTYEIRDIAADSLAQFELRLYNLSQVIPEENRDFKLSLVQGSNPDGAIIQVSGAVLGDDQLSHSLPPNTDNPRRETVRVGRERGSVYDYEDMQLHLYSTCDSQIDTTVTFDVHFIKPCGDVSIITPEKTWIVNSSHNQMMDIVLKDYDAGNQNMIELKFEYRLNGTDDAWSKLFSYPRATLPADSILYSWDMSPRSEGVYDLRASTHCTAGIFYTRTHAGIFDYTAPVVFGKPQPADELLHSGEDISVKFTDAVDCRTANTDNLKLRNISKDLDVAIDIVCTGDELVISPVNQADMIEGDSMRVTIQSLSDPFGNVIAEPISWAFVVNLVTHVSEGSDSEIPTEFSLYQNYPNPFNPETTIRFGIPKAGEVELSIYNINGQVIKRPVAEQLAPGFYNVTVSGSNLSSGMYFYVLRSGNFVQTKKLILLK